MGLNRLVIMCDERVQEDGSSPMTMDSDRQVRMVRLRFTDGFSRRTWPKNLRRLVRMMLVSGGLSVRRRTFSLKMRAHQGTASIVRFPWRCDRLR